MKFSDVIGHAEIKDKLSALIGERKLPHALMLLSPEGSGGLPMALAIAQNLVCEKRSGKKQEEDLFAAPALFGDAPAPSEKLELTDACGQCAACQKAEKFIHPDIHFTFPVVLRKSGTVPVSADWIVEWRKALTENPYLNVQDWLQQIGAENRQGNITIKECHEITRRMTLKNYEAATKVQIIWLAEYLKEAGNSLLKIIEEPPADTVFILVVENIEQILNTIISRTQIVKLQGIEDEALSAYLQKNYETDASTALRIARFSDGNLNAALEYAQGAEHPHDALLREWLSLCLRIKGSQAAETSVKLIEFVEGIAKIGRENQKIFLKYFLWFLREASILSLGISSEKLEGTELEFAKKLATVLTIETTEKLQDIINSLHYAIERNGNPKVLFVSNSFKIAAALRKEKVVSSM